jgi:hypothetical protein
MAAYVVVLALMLLGMAGLALVLRRYVQMRGTRLVNCPETNDTVAVEVDAGHAALTGALGKARFELTSCTRWPERYDCGRECLAQIEAAPIDCLVRTQLAAWYAGKSCVVCGKPFGAVDWMTHRPGLMEPGGAIMKWQDIQAEKLAEVVASHKPVCWDCFVAETFRRQHPELVIDNPWKRSQPPA